MIGAAQVLLADPVDPTLQARLQGQLGDLGWEVRGLAEAVPPGPQPVVEAQALGEGARAVLWIGLRGDQATLLLVDRAAATRWDRTVEIPPDPSAAQEVLALVLRSMLAGLEASPLGVAVPAPSVPEAHAYRLGVAWQSSVDGQAPVGRHALGLSAGIAWDRFAFGLGAAFGLPSTEVDPRANLALTRHALTAELEWIDPAATWTWGLSGQAGVALYRRSTIVSDPGLEATPPTDRLAGVFGLAAVGRWAPEALAGVGLELGLGADAVLGAPRLLYQIGPDQVQVGAVWPLQPRVTLALVLR